jgi:hypothetical protein
VKRRRAKGTGWIAFIAHADVLREEFAKGHSMAAVHAKYTAELGGLCYVQFTRYVNRTGLVAGKGVRPAAPAQLLLPLEKPAALVAARAPAEPPQSARQPPEEAGDNKAAAGERRFVFDPTAVNTKDLI